MPLSEHEQRMLDEMERALYADDPAFGTGLLDDDLTGGHGQQRRADGVRVVVGLAAVVAGLGLLVYGLSIQQVWVGVLAFVLMVAGAVWALSARGRSRPEPPSLTTDYRGHLTVIDGGGAPSPRRAPGTSGRHGATPGGQGDLMRRLEQRWDDRRRREGRDF